VGYLEAMSGGFSSGLDVERNHHQQQTASVGGGGGGVLSVVDGQRKQRALRQWVRRLRDNVSEGGEVVWPAGALLTVATLVVIGVWLCRMQSAVHDASSLYQTLTLESHLHDVIAAVQHERQCAAAAAATCLTSSTLR